jgi:hypothetical protein
MQPTPTAKTDRTAEVEPAIRHTVPWRVASVTARDDARLRVKFVDGTEGDVDMEAFLADPVVEGTPFGALRDRAIFAQVSVVLGAVQWPNGADLAPDAMYDAIRQHGVWVVS